MVHDYSYLSIYLLVLHYDDSWGLFHSVRSVQGFCGAFVVLLVLYETTDETT